MISLTWSENLATKLTLTISLGIAALWLSACGSNAPVSNAPFNPSANTRSEPPRGFFERLGDNLTERECAVFRFTCPYGFGPAGEPCECTDPRGRVIRGQTIK